MTDSDPLQLLIVDSTDSTNSFMRRLPERPPHGYAVAALSQTCGRGQRGKSWEAEPGCNVTLSVALRPRGIRAADQFLLSAAISVEVALMLAAEGVPQVSIKWPNDIYAGGSRKIAGILIENSLVEQEISLSVAGIGLNVNQTLFRSDAPNPVSMTMLTGRRHDLRDMIDKTARAILRGCRRAAEESPEALMRQYCLMQWRREGMHPYADSATGERFLAEIAEIAPDGMLTLRPAGGGPLRRYAFKEVTALL